MPSWSSHPSAPRRVSEGTVPGHRHPGETGRGHPAPRRNRQGKRSPHAAGSSSRILLAKASPPGCWARGCPPCQHSGDRAPSWHAGTSPDRATAAGGHGGSDPESRFWLQLGGLCALTGRSGAGLALPGRASLSCPPGQGHGWGRGTLTATPRRGKAHTHLGSPTAGAGEHPVPGTCRQPNEVESGRIKPPPVPVPVAGGGKSPCPRGESGAKELGHCRAVGASAPSLVPRSGSQTDGRNGDAKLSRSWSPVVQVTTAGQRGPDARGGGWGPGIGGGGRVAETWR